MKTLLSFGLGAGLLTLTACGGGGSSSSVTEAGVAPGAVNTESEVQMTGSLSAIYGSMDYLRSLLLIEPLLNPEQDGLHCDSGSVTQSELSLDLAATNQELTLAFDQCLLSNGATLNGDVAYEWTNYRNNESEIVLSFAGTQFRDFSVTLTGSSAPVTMEGELATSYVYRRDNGEISRITQSQTAQQAKISPQFTVSYNSRQWRLEDYLMGETQAADGSIRLTFNATMSDLAQASGTSSRVETVQTLLIMPGDPAPRSGLMKITTNTDAATLQVDSADNVTLLFDLGADGTDDERVELSWNQLLNY